jgi:hypothetical protein
MATPDDLAQTEKEVEALGRRIVVARADVRDYGGLKKALDDGWLSRAGWTSRAPTPGSSRPAGPASWTRTPGGTRSTPT